MEAKIKEFLKESNYIEGEYSEEAFEDAKKAWKYAFENKDKINLKYILKIHYLLAQRINPDIAGKLRECDVWIGGYRKIFVSVGLLEAQLKDCINIIFLSLSIKNSTIYKKEEMARRCHVEFENVHPFCDGNGRVGRILWQVHRLKLGLPILVIKENEKDRYYEWFK